MNKKKSTLRYADCGKVDLEGKTQEELTRTHSPATFDKQVFAYDKLANVPVEMLPSAAVRLDAVKNGDASGERVVDVPYHLHLTEKDKRGRPVLVQDTSLVPDTAYVTFPARSAAEARLLFRLYVERYTSEHAGRGTQGDLNVVPERRRFQTREELQAYLKAEHDERRRKARQQTIDAQKRNRLLKKLGKRVTEEEYKQTAERLSALGVTVTESGHVEGTNMPIKYVQSQTSKDAERARLQQEHAEQRRAELSAIRADLDASMPVPITVPDAPSGETLLRPLTAEEVTRRNVAYEASAEFIAESFKTANVERHNHDNITLRVKHDQNGGQGKDAPLSRQSAEIDKQKQADCKRQQFVAAAKKAQGLKEVVAGCIVTLLFIEDKEQTRYYMVSAEKYHSHGIEAYVNQPDAPPSGADECLRVDSALGQALMYAFAQDEVEVHAHGGVFKCRILSVEDVQTQTATKLLSNKTVQSLQASDDAQPHTAIGSGAFNFAVRDSGRFGSFSKHDDYGDASDAEVCDYDERFEIDADD